MNAEVAPFAARYGPWALIIGASEGVGAAFADAMAERGVNVVLLARRAAVLEELAGAIRERTGAATRSLAIDLVDGDAMERIVAGTHDLDVGIVMYCAGADPVYERFLDHPIELALGLVQRNCVMSLRVCHHFAQPMVARGRGGIVLLSSAAGFFGGPNVVAYSASKAFDMVMAESLWVELRSSGVDVLSLILGGTDTPALRRLLTRRGLLTDPTDPAAIPGLSTPQQVAAAAIEHIADGPSWIEGAGLAEQFRLLGSMPRNDAVQAVMAKSAELMDTHHSGGTR